MTDDIAIKVDGVSKTFKLPREKQSTVKGALINFKHIKKGYEKQQVLKNVSFEIKKGEFFGIVGRNGSGKSTLLKLLAGIYTADKGKIIINGKLTPFIELGVGFNPELSGRENVFLNGALLGFNRKETEVMYDEIVEFSELEPFMDQKLKNYSSGMQVRLAFSIAIRADAEILVLDEVLAVGDEAFQRKCNDYFMLLKKQGKTVVLVTHSMEAVEKFCDRALILKAGTLKSQGDPHSISSEYKLENLDRPIVKNNSESLNSGVNITKVEINGGNAVIPADDEIRIDIYFSSIKKMNIFAGISFIKDDGTYIAYFNSRENLGLTSIHKTNQECITCIVPSSQFLGGAYEIDVALYDRYYIYLSRRTKIASFAISRESISKGGAFNIQGIWVH